jgi:hypothetical protein
MRVCVRALHHHLHIVDSFFGVGAKHVHLWTVTNMFQRDTRIFAAPNPAVVGIDLTTDMRRALITSPDLISQDFFLMRNS